MLLSETEYIIDTSKNILITLAESIQTDKRKWLGTKDEISPYNGKFDGERVSYLWFLKRSEEKPTAFLKEVK